LQAALLSVKLKNLDADNQKRRVIAKYYIDNINNGKVVLPCLKETDILNDERHVWHVFVVRIADRKSFQQYLAENGVQTVIHYPIPPHKQKAYSFLATYSYPISEKIHEQIISLPISPVMTKEEYVKVAVVVNAYQG